jgi:single-stranded-DNA-specific exonuclease
MQKTWQIQHRIKGKEHDKRQGEIVAALLKHRGIITLAQKKSFLHPLSAEKISLKEVGIHPKEIKKVEKRLQQVFTKQELVIVYGDYDADGITATAVLWETLHELGINVFPFIPHREEHGYGLKKEGVDSIIDQYGKPALIITVDNGIVAFEGAQYCRDQGIDLIISDHHQVKTEVRSKKQEVRERKAVYPEALAIVHTDKLAGAGVSWFLAREIARGFKKRKITADKLELVAIGTVADMVPLLGANRSLAKFGLEQLQRTQRPGLQALLTEARIDLTKLSAYHINFVIAPRLNAMGRLEHALDSLRLLCTKDTQRAIQLSVDLGATNQQRQDLTFAALRHAESLVAGQEVFEKKLLFVSHESYDQGVVGLVAGKLVEKYWRPTIVIAQEKEFSKGSVRSIPGVNIIELLRQFEPEFVDLGGHPMAAGFTIETKKIPQLQKRLETLAAEQIAEALLSPVLEIECLINLRDISQNLYEQLVQFEPFGVGNPRPVLAAEDVTVAQWRVVGKDERHVKLTVSSGKSQATSLDAIFFNGADTFANLETQKPVDVAFQVDENEWNGRKSLQLVIKDIRAY